jgi:Tol biopolymer transport system component
LPIVAGWSPDANWTLWWKDVGFSSSIAADGLELLATSTDGTTRRIVSPVLVHQDFLTWCGDRLVVAAGGFRDVRSGKRLFVASPPNWQASTSPNDRPPNWIWPSCSPDGRRVAATAGIPPPSQQQRTIWLEAPSGSGRYQLFPSSRSRADDLPRWSRDGGSILFVRLTLKRRPSAALFFASVDPTSGSPLGVAGPIANLGSYIKGYDLGYGYYSWSEGTDWFQPNS